MQLTICKTNIYQFLSGLCLGLQGSPRWNSYKADSNNERKAVAPPATVASDSRDLEQTRWWGCTTQSICSIANEGKWYNWSFNRLLNYYTSPPPPGANLWLMWFWSRLELLFPAINFLLIRFSIGLQEVSYLQRILSRTLHEVDVHAIFRCVSIKLVYWTACFLVFMVHKMVLGIPFLQASCHNLPFNNFRVIFSLGH